MLVVTWDEARLGRRAEGLQGVRGEVMDRYISYQIHRPLFGFSTRGSNPALGAGYNNNDQSHHAEAMYSMM